MTCGAALPLPPVLLILGVAVVLRHPGVARSRCSTDSAGGCSLGRPWDMRATSSASRCSLEGAVEAARFISLVLARRGCFSTVPCGSMDSSVTTWFGRFSVGMSSMGIPEK